MYHVRMPNRINTKKETIGIHKYCVTNVIVLMSSVGFSTENCVILIIGNRNYDIGVEVCIGMDINRKTREWQESCNQARLRCGWIKCQKEENQKPGDGDNTNIS